MPDPAVPIVHVLDCHEARVAAFALRFTARLADVLELETVSDDDRDHMAMLAARLEET